MNAPWAWVGRGSGQSILYTVRIQPAVGSGAKKAMLSTQTTMIIMMVPGGILNYIVGLHKPCGNSIFLFFPRGEWAAFFSKGVSSRAVPHGEGGGGEREGSEKTILSIQISCGVIDWS